MLENIVGNVLSFIVLNKYTLLSVFGIFIFTFIFWAMWVTLNIAYNRRKRLVYKLLLIVGVIPGLIVDVLYNKTIAWALFLEWGKESTLSMRLTRYLRTNDTGRTIFYIWNRKQVAVWLATYLIEPWGQGHIGLERFGYPASQNYIDTAIKWLKARGI